MSERPGMDSGEALFELRVARNHAVIVLVSVVDRRIVPALRFVSRLGYGNTRALHVSVDPEETLRLARDWMDLELTWLPLHIHDETRRSVSSNVVEAVREEATCASTVTVVLPEYDTRRWWHPFLHRCTARRIAADLHSLPGVTAVIVPFAARPRHRRRLDQQTPRF
jgi:hypothetical protein